MERSHATCRTLASFVLLLLMSLVAQAQLNQTWVAGDGNDANPCTRIAPCQTFAAAIIQTASGGEINAKSAGDFGPVTIDKSITIDGGGTFTGSGSGGIRIDDSTSATPNTALVTLRRLSISGTGGPLGSNGVYFSSGKTLNIEDCRIFNFSNAGVQIFLLSDGKVNIKNTNIFSVTRGVQAAGDFLTVSLNGCHIENTLHAGVWVSDGAHVSIRNSLIQFNVDGVWAGGGHSSVNIVSSQINHNTRGLAIETTSHAILGSSTFMSNATNFSNYGTIQTFGDNATETSIHGIVTNLALQ